MSSGTMSLLISLVVFVGLVDVLLGGCVLDPICSKSTDCLNGGTCFKNVCHCTDFYIGDHCETAFQCKTDADCLHRGKCSKCSPGFKATCDCAFGYIGANCDINDGCVKQDTICSTLSDCNNGGICHGNVCHCTNQYRGDHCEMGYIADVYDCASSPCQNDATCTESVEGYDCECADGFVGDNCEAVLTKAEQMTTISTVICVNSNDCKHGGTCYENVCHCINKYIGERCDTAFVCKTDADCLNKGKCPGNNAACQCALGYFGANCALTYSCKTRNPCFKKKAGGIYYFEQTDRTKYIQCDGFGNCFDQTCPPGTVWNQSPPGCSHLKL